MSDLPPVNDAPGIPCPIPGMQENYLIRKGDFVVLTGIPGHGKSTFMNDVCCKMAAMHDWRVAFASFEQLPQTDHRRSLRTWHAGKPINYMSQQEIYEADAWIDRHFRFIVPAADDFANLEWLVERCAMAVVQHNCDMIVIDPWNEVDHCRERDESLTEYTGRAIKRLKKMANRLNIHLVVAAHPAKMRRQDDGSYLPPNLYDVSDSQHWYNKADVGLTVYRPDPENERTDVYVTKARYHTINGKISQTTLSYDFPRRTYKAGL
jgi:twinkle protein